MYIAAIIIEWNVVSAHFLGGHAHDAGKFFFEVYSIPGTILFTLAFLLLSYKVLWQFLKNLVKGHLLDENFLMIFL